MTNETLRDDARVAEVHRIGRYATRAYLMGLSIIAVLAACTFGVTYSAQTIGFS